MNNANTGNKKCSDRRKALVSAHEYAIQTGK